ncbi:MAG: CRTAC1 family protein [Alphaproteobacteria bacterium]|nr:CRTAC1 family protein [Alphaproteobacteria bacterium]
MRTLALVLAACAPAPEGGDDDTRAGDTVDRDTDRPPLGLPAETDTGSAPAPRSPVEAAAPWTCADPDARQAVGPLRPADTQGDWGAQPFDPERRTLFTGGGLTVADLDGDGRHDVFLPDLVASRLYLQTPDGRLALADDRLPALDRDLVVSATAADVDDDGDLDLFVARYGGTNALWRNDDGRFVDVTKEAGVAGDPLGRTAAGSFADLDRDGALDLFVATHGGLDGVGREPGPPSHLYLGRGDGTFHEVSERLSEDVQTSYTFLGGWHDLDDDGWLDLYVVNDFGNRRPNRVMWNREGVLVPDASGSGLEVGLQGMGLGVGDLDGRDGPEVVVAGWGNNRLLQRAGGSWYDVHEAAGVRGDAGRLQVVGWATELGDLDHDGDLDVVEGFGHIWNQRTPPAQPDEIFRNDGPAGFTRVGQAWGFDHPGQTRAVLAVDLDGDGWLDLLRADLTGPATLQRARCGHLASLVIRPRQAGANAFAVGARVRVIAGERTWTRWVHAGGTSILASGPPEVHVGLGSLAEVDGFEVTWPDGVVERFEGAATGRVVTLRRRADR